MDMATNNVNVIEPLGNRGEALLKANMADGETILVKLKGSFGEAFVVTDRRIYILKYGFMAGRTFRGQCTAYRFNQITGLESRKTLVTGILEVLTATDRDTGSKTLWGVGKKSAVRADNTIAYSLMFQGASFQRGFSIARETIQEAVSANTVYAVGHESAADEIGKLALLRDKGTLTEEEFQAKKRQLLGR